MADRYVHHIRVRYGEVDMQRVVFNSHYLAYCDDAVESWDDPQRSRRNVTTSCGRMAPPCASSTQIATLCADHCT